jgi:beta-galactosidase
MPYRRIFRVACFWLCVGPVGLAQLPPQKAANGPASAPARERIALDSDWKFYKYAAGEKPDDLIYDVRPAVRGNAEFVAGINEKATESVRVEAKQDVLKPWIMPTGNEFINDPTKRFARPEGNPGGDFPFVRPQFDDSGWQTVTLPHDWAIQGPFYSAENAPVGGGMGRLPSPGVAWYRRKLDITAADAGKSVFLDVDGAMAYSMVWINGKLAGGWPYGYNSWRVDLTPYLEPGGHNQLAIRLDNPPDSSRWYPGGGLYRNVWLLKTQPLHVAHWGTWITTPKVSKTSATIDLQVVLDNGSKSEASARV